MSSDRLQDYLRDFLQAHTPFLKRVLGVYVLRMRVAYGEQVHVVVDEILHEAVVQVMLHGEQFLAIREPRAWFLAVANNLIKRRRVMLSRRARFEVPMSELLSNSLEREDVEVFDLLMNSDTVGPEQLLEAQDQACELLALVSRTDASVLDLAVLRDLDASAVGRVLGISPQAARVRLHRALQRLRQAWQRREAAEQGEG